MKKTVTILLAIFLCLPLMAACGTQDNSTQVPARAPDILIKVGKLEAGMVVGEIDVRVTFDGRSALSRK